MIDCLAIVQLSVKNNECPYIDKIKSFFTLSPFSLPQKILSQSLFGRSQFRVFLLFFLLPHYLTIHLINLDPSPKPSNCLSCNNITHSIHMIVNAKRVHTLQLLVHFPELLLRPNRLFLFVLFHLSFFHCLRRFFRFTTLFDNFYIVNSNSNQK